MSGISFIVGLSLISACDREEKTSKAKAYYSKHEDPIYIGGGIMISEVKKGPLQNHIRAYTGLDWTTPLRDKSIMYDFDAKNNVERIYIWDGEKWAETKNSGKAKKNFTKDEIRKLLEDPKLKITFADATLNQGVAKAFLKKKLEALLEKIEAASLQTPKKDESTTKTQPK